MSRSIPTKVRVNWTLGEEDTHDGTCHKVCNPVQLGVAASRLTHTVRGLVEPNIGPYCLHFPIHGLPSNTIDVTLRTLLGPF